MEDGQLAGSEHKRLNKSAGGGLWWRYINVCDSETPERTAVFQCAA